MCFSRARRRVIKSLRFPFLHECITVAIASQRRDEESFSPRNKKRIANGAFFFSFALSGRAAFLPRKRRLLKSRSATFARIGRAAAGYSPSLSFEKIEEWVDEGAG